MLAKVSGFLLLGVSLVMIGCGGPSGYEVTGKATAKGGAPFTLAEGEKVVVMLEGQDGKNFGTPLEADGTFKFTGEQGVLPGNYRVSYVRYAAKPKGPPKPVPVESTWTVAPDKREFTLEIK